MRFDFADLLLDVLERRASDLHLTAGSQPMIRVRGRLVALEEYPKLMPADTREIIYWILTNDQRQRLETDWQIDFAYAIPGKARFRVNAYFQRSSLGAAFRLIPSIITPIDDLGLPPVVHDFCKKPRGFVLVTGPTGSGKSTSLASMIDEINETREEHILTVEDPIEFLHGHKKCIVNQRELGSDAQSFAAALKGALRQDPDVILVGEMRDLETISHRADRGGDRPPRVRDAAHAGRAADDRPHHRRVPEPPAAAGARAALGRPAGRHDPDAAADRRRLRPRASPARCSCPTPAVRNLIREGKTHQIYSAMQTGGASGMQTMDAALATLVRAGQDHPAPRRGDLLDAGGAASA